MKRVIPLIVLLLTVLLSNGQGIKKRIAGAIAIIEADSQMKNAILGFYVAEQKSGKVVFGRNAEVGLQAASAQKVITSAASLELMGADYRYTTDLAYSGKIENGILNGDLYLFGNGDPTLGSWRYDNTKEQVVLDKWIQSIKQAGIKQVNNVIAFNNKWETQTLPGGWIWDDIGNYYGAGVAALNWRENQYDLILKSGNKTGEPVSIVTMSPRVFDAELTSEVTTGKPGSGDNAYIYLPPYSSVGFVRGTIPPGQLSFTISGSFPNPPAQLMSLFSDELRKQNIKVGSVSVINNTGEIPPGVNILHKHYSPPLDSINYWFLKKSVNLYGEALVKTLGYEKNNEGSADAGLKIIKTFWKGNSIAPTAINMLDGSGLSPQNRVTAEALVGVMQYARSRPWFSSFYHALPEINGIKMKSGTIGGVKSFTGYAGSYTFAIIINNFSGSSADMVRKMYKVLDMLK